MFAPVLDDEEEEELHQLHHHQHPNERGLAFGMMLARVVKINNILLILSLGVATFVQFSTLEPVYVNALMWGEDEHEDILTPQSMILRTLESLVSVLLLTFLRSVVFPSTQQPADATFEAVLSDLLFHIQCRLIIGFLACFTIQWVPFDLLETAVVCISVSMQIAKLVVLQ